MNTKFSLALTAFTCLSVVGCGGAATTTTQTTLPDDAPMGMSYFQIGGTESNFGETTLASGFMPDPFTVNVVSGSTSENEVDVTSAGIPAEQAGNCTGYATREPDFILHLETASDALRFFVSSAGDTTLIINDGGGRWWCSDDEGGNLNPMVDIANAPAGQYDIWVGSYAEDANIEGVLSVTELLDSVHP